METKGQTVLQRIKNHKGTVRHILTRYRSRIKSDMKLLAYIFFDHGIKNPKTNPNKISIMTFLSYFANKHFGNPATIIRAKRDVVREHPELNFTEQAQGNFKVIERVKAQLEKCPPCRNSDLKLIMSIWLSDAKFNNLDVDHDVAYKFLILMANNNVTNPVSIVRERAKLQKKFPELQGNTKSARVEEEKEVRNHNKKTNIR